MPEAATATFLGTGINITTQGKRHLGAALGTGKFVEEFVQKKVMSWVKEIDHLSSIVIAHPVDAHTHLHTNCCYSSAVLLLPQFHILFFAHFDMN